TRALQGWVGVSQDGSLSRSDIRALQGKVGAVQDGKIGSETTRKLRAAMGLGGNGVWDFRSNYSTVKALPQYLNARCRRLLGRAPRAAGGPRSAAAARGRASRALPPARPHPTGSGRR